MATDIEALKLTVFRSHSAKVYLCEVVVPPVPVPQRHDSINI